MTDFIESFNKGIEAARKADQNKDEIDSVIAALNTQLDSVSSGRVKVDLLLKSNPISDFLAITEKRPIKGQYWVIAAQNPLAEAPSPRELAQWKSDPNGYPCQIITNDEEIYCEDKTALERGLNYLISTPDIGKILWSVMNQKIKPQ